jgi:hypothetical protein
MQPNYHNATIFLMKLPKIATILPNIAALFS